MRQLARELVFLTIVGMGTVIIIQIAVDMLDVTRQIRAERRRAHHPAQGKPRYE